jgi:predicted RecB family nuclease
MATRITRDILEAHLSCRYKGHLKQLGEAGMRSEFEELSAELRSAVRKQALDRITSRAATRDVLRDVTLTLTVLQAGPAFVLDPLLEDDTVSFRFDGLQKVDGASKLGDFHYVPVFFHSGPVRKEQRLLLDVCALVLSRIQGRMPSLGIVWHGRECRMTKLRLSADPRKAERILRELQQTHEAEVPRLILNDHCQVCEFRGRCHDQALREDGLSLLRGLGDKEVRGYARKGILTLTQLAHTFRPRRKGKRVMRPTNPRSHALHALALRDKKIYLFGTPEIPGAPVQIYLDLEGVPEERFVYLIGLTVVEGGTARQLSFWADTPDQEQEIFQQFLEEVSRYPDARLYCYGTYERQFLKRMRKTASRKGPVDRILAALVNVLSVVHSHAYFPCYSNGLKDVAGCLGSSWSDPQASGLQSIIWRRRWETTGVDEWKQKLLTYNREDCEALHRVTEFLRAHGAEAGESGGTKPAGEFPPAVSVEEIPRLGAGARWGDISFVHPDYEHINNCARFDYQRQRVYVRTSRILKKTQRKGYRRNRKLRISRCVRIVGRKCPKCGCADLVQLPHGKRWTGHYSRHRTVFDLVFTAGGIRRQVIECRAAVHECRGCGNLFTPARYDRVAKHFHGLRSWAMYEYVAHRSSYNEIVKRFEELFGLVLGACEIHQFKAMMSRFYTTGYRRLLKKMLSGPVLYADETEVNLRSSKGYVWVFATTEEVVYLYRPSREGEFLGKLLAGFRGVLVSDFYPAYDSLPCPQQKCLIHLMRDINQDLLNNPFDTELQTITEPFGALLRGAVEEIDRSGLRRRYLEKHQGAVDTFFEGLAARSFQSETAEALRARLLKCRDKLFTFLHHDGVTWNNNNAENAIRQFAYYRERAVGCLTETGLSNYLVLLSLYQTCRYRGVSFLKFLRSRERDIDSFCAHPRRKRKRPLLELYQKGFMRPEFQREKRGAESEAVPTEPTALQSARVS